MDRPRRHPARRPVRPRPPTQLDEAADVGDRGPAATPTSRSRAAPCVADDTNSLADVVEEVRFQQSTARSSIAPAVLSLVLVALALLMRLLNAASELRVPELALASLRGVTARRLWGLGLAEPLARAPDRDPARHRLRRSGSRWCSCAAGSCPGLPLPLPVGELGRGRRWCCSRPSPSRASRSAWWCASRSPPSSAAYDVRWPRAAGRSSPSSPSSRSPWRRWPASSRRAVPASPTPPTSCCRCCSPWSPASPPPGSPPCSRRGGPGARAAARSAASSPRGRSRAARRARW